MKRSLFLLWFVLLIGVPAQAQTAATFAERQAFASDATWMLRVQYAFTKTAIDVVQEDEATASHAERLLLARSVLNPMMGNRAFTERLAGILVALTQVVITKAGDGTVSTSITDAALASLISNIWTQLSQVMSIR